MEFTPFDPTAERTERERNLPHWRQDEATYFVTFRLADSLPQSEVAVWRKERERWFRSVGLGGAKELHKLPLTQRDEYRQLFSRRIEDWLDAGKGECWLRDPRCAEVVAGALQHFDGERYVLGPFVVMPNHVHVLVRPKDGYDLSNVLHSWKSFTAHHINELLGRSGSVWMDESYDHIVRDYSDLDHIERYIAENPAKAGLQRGTFFFGVGRFWHPTPHRPEACVTTPSLTKLLVRHFRCFAAREVEFAPGLNLIVGPNAHGKTSLLEAACILLRLASPRVTRLAPVIQHGQRGFVVDGYFGPRHLQFYFSSARKKLALDAVEQKTATEYLQLGRVMWFSNSDIEIARGSGEVRRRFLDFVAAQIDAGYRAALRDYERALRSRNHLLKSPAPRWREIAAFDAPLLASGDRVMAARRRLVAELQPETEAAHAVVSGRREALRLEYVPGAGDDFPAALAAAQGEDARLRQTTVGPHRDELAFFLNETPAADFASEGQQRTLVFALRLGAARLLERKHGDPPLLLIDDIFGELDLDRRGALLAALPTHAQKLITTTHIDWLSRDVPAQVLRLGE